MKDKALLILTVLLLLSLKVHSEICRPAFYIKGGDKSIELIPKKLLNKSMQIMVFGAEPDSLINVEVTVSRNTGVMTSISDKWKDGLSPRIKTLIMSAPEGSVIYIGGSYKKNGKTTSIINTLYKVCSKKEYQAEYEKRAKINRITIHNMSALGDMYFYKTYGDATLVLGCENVRNDLVLVMCTLKVFDKDKQLKFEEEITDGQISKKAQAAIESCIDGKLIINRVMFKDKKKNTVLGEVLDYDIVN